MGLKDLYYKIEDKYYSFLDWLDSKGVALYKLDDWLNEHNIPSFPTISIVALLLLVLIVYLILWGTGVVGAEKINVTMTFLDTTTNTIVPNLAVSLQLDGETVSKTTDSAGEIAIIVEKDKPVVVSIDSDNYRLKKHNFVFTEDGQSVDVELENTNQLFLKKTFSLISDPTTKQLFLKPVDLTVKCTEADYEKAVSVEDGQFDLEDIPQDCGQLVVSAEELNFNDIVSLEEDSPEIVISKDSVATGKIIVSAIDVNGNPLSNIYVSALNEENIKGADGVVMNGVLELTVPVGKYYLVASDNTNNFAPINTLEDEENLFNAEVKKDEEVSVVLKFSKQSFASIKLNVVDVKGDPVTGGSVSFYKNGIETGNLTLDSNGFCEFAVGENVPYRIVIDNPKYMVYDVDNVYPKEEPYKIVLSPVSTNPVLSVKVIGPDKEPVANATVVIYKESEEKPVITKTTGMDGVAEFRRLTAGAKYYAKVVKGEYDAKTTFVVLDPRKRNELIALLNIGNGDVVAKVVDLAGNPIKDAKVEFYDALTNKRIGVPTSSDENGLARITVRADKTVYVKVSVEGKADSYSLAKDVQAGVTTNLKAYLVDVSSGLKLSLLGIYDKDTPINSSPVRVVAGTKYKALFLLEIPEGQVYDEGKVLFKVDDVKDLEHSSLYLENINLLGSSLLKGTTFSEPNGFADDMVNKTSGKGLWALADIKNVKSGTFLVEVDFGVVNEPVKNTLSFNYRAELRKANSYYRFPIDEELGQSASIADRDGFYAKMDSFYLLVGNAVCSNVFCGEFEYEDGLTKSKVIDSMYLQQNTSYKFNIVNLFATSKRKFKDAKLEIVSETGGINFDNANLKLNNKTVNTNITKHKVTMALGNVYKSLNIKGNLVLKAVASGKSPLMIRIVDKDNQMLFEHKVDVEVEPAKSFSVALVPQIIVPFVNNALLVVVNDKDTNLGVENAFVEVRNNEVVVASGMTDSDGKFGFELQKPNVGDVVSIKVTATGYKEIVKVIKVNENILYNKPNELSITINRAVADYFENKFTLYNVTPLALRIVNFKLATGDYEKYVNVEFAKDYIGKVIDNNLDVNYRFELTDLGKNVLEPKEFSTDLIINVEGEKGLVWKVTIPVKIYIKLRDSLDKQDCLVMKPLLDDEEDVWNVVVGNKGETKSQDFVLINTCSYKNQPVTLYKVDFSAVWKGKSLGKFKVNGETIGKKPKMLLEELNPGETQITVEFNANESTIADAKEATLKVDAKYPTNNGLQSVKAEAKANVVVSDLSRCIEVVGPNGTLNGFKVNNIPVVVLGVNPNGLGYSMYNQQFGNMPFGMGMPAMNGVPVNSGNLPYYITGDNLNYFFGVNGLYADKIKNPMITGAGFGGLAGVNPNIYSGYNMGYGMMMGQTTLLPSIAEFEITNRCKFAVDLKIRATPQLMIDASNLKLEPNKTRKIRVVSTFYAGAYNVELLGAYSNNAIAPILRIPVLVKDLDLEGITPDCFALSENPINMSNFINTPKTITLYNNCYMKGVTFANPAVSLRNLLVLKSFIESKGLKVQSEGMEPKTEKGPVNQERTEIPYVTASAGLAMPKTDAKYGKIQYVDVELAKNPNIIRADRFKPSKDKGLSSAVDLLSKIRTSATKQYMSVNFPAKLIVRARLGTGPGAIEREVPIKINVVDNWNFAGFINIAEDATNMGDPKCTPEKWTGKVLENTTLTYTLNDDAFDGYCTTVPLGTYETILNTDGSNCFGNGDSVEFPQTYITSDDSLEIVPMYEKIGKLSFNVCVKKSLSKGSHTYTLPISYIINSYRFDVGRQYASRTFTLKLVLNLKNPIKVEGKAEEVEAKETEKTESEKQKDRCNDILKGSEPLSKYLTENKISFAYDNINCNAFSSDGKYCDAQQLASYLASKTSWAKDTKNSPNSLTAQYCNLNNVQYLCKDDKISMLHFKDVFFPEDLDEFYEDLQNIFSEDKVQKTNYDNFVNKVNNKLDSYENDLSKYLVLVFRKQVNNGSCPSGSYKVDNGNYCYLFAKDLSEENANKFFEDLKNNYESKKEDYDVGFLLSTNEEGKLLSTYYKTKALTEKGKTPLDYGYAVVYLKPDNYKDAMNAVKGKFLNTYNIEINSFNSFTEPGIYVLKLEKLKNNKYNVSVKKIKTTDKKDILYKLVFDPVEPTSGEKNYGMCIKDGEYALSSSQKNKYVLREHKCGNNAIYRIDVKVGDHFELSAEDKGDGTLKVAQKNYNLIDVFNNSQNYCIKTSENEVIIKEVK